MITSLEPLIAAHWSQIADALGIYRGEIPTNLIPPPARAAPVVVIVQDHKPPNLGGVERAPFSTLIPGVA